MNERYCPICGVDTQAEPIPEESQKYYGNHTHFSKWLGHVNYDYCTFSSCPNGCMFTRQGEYIPPSDRTPEKLEALAKHVIRRIYSGVP